MFFNGFIRHQPDPAAGFQGEICEAELGVFLVHFTESEAGVLILLLGNERVGEVLHLRGQVQRAVQAVGFPRLMSLHDANGNLARLVGGGPEMEAIESALGQVQLGLIELDVPAGLAGLGHSQQSHPPVGPDLHSGALMLLKAPRHQALREIAVGKHLRPRRLVADVPGPDQRRRVSVPG